ncbi:hypothetical protein Ciccas_005577 [Cichlidogyrus casuarinus]|uniref:Uncharacterized protein n=1 Tax=Cichlidogyrus casuarinus TaxID=1844966 RepID=A0ABD2Q8G8_9PLAT
MNDKQDENSSISTLENVHSLASQVVELPANMRSLDEVKRDLRNNLADTEEGKNISERIQGLLMGADNAWSLKVREACLKYMQNHQLNTFNFDEMLKTVLPIAIAAIPSSVRKDAKRMIDEAVDKTKPAAK